GRISRTRICAHYCGFGPFCRRNWGRAMKRILTVILSVVFFAIVYCWVSFVTFSPREHNVCYFSLFDTFIFVFFYDGFSYFLTCVFLKHLFFSLFMLVLFIFLRYYLLRSL